MVRTGQKFSLLNLPFVPFFLPFSKLTQDNRIESPIPILPVPTPNAETEKLIKMKDEEVRRICFGFSLLLNSELL